MTPEEVKAMIAKLAAEEESLVEAMKKADVRLAQVRAARTALAALDSEEPIQFDGKMADACRAVLKKNTGHSLSPLEVRDELKAIGYDFSQHAHGNIMAVVHSVLKSLERSGEIKSKEAKDGSGTRYWWPTGTTVREMAGKGFSGSILSTLEQYAPIATKIQASVLSADLEKFSSVATKIAEMAKEYESSQSTQQLKEYMKELERTQAALRSAGLLK